MVDSDITLAALGETLKRSPHLGELVDCITLNEERDVATGMAHDEIWLEESFVRAFEGLTHVKTIRIHRTDLHVLLSHRILQTAAFKSATKLVLSSPNNIPYSALRHLHYSSSLRTLCVLSPMKYEAANGPPSLFAGVSSGITKVKMSSEPHAREYASFFGHCNNLEELDIRSGTTDVAFVFASLADTTKASLRALAFSSQGYLSVSYLRNATSLSFLTSTPHSAILTRPSLDCHLSNASPSGDVSLRSHLSSSQHSPLFLWYRSCSVGPATPSSAISSTSYNPRRDLRRLARSVSMLLWATVGEGERRPCGLLGDPR